MRAFPNHQENGRENNGKVAKLAGKKLSEQRMESVPLNLVQEPEPTHKQQFLEHLDVDRIAIFIDGSNLFYAALQLGIEIDYAKLLCKLTCGRRLLRAYFYTGVDRANERQQGFLLWMQRNGYRVVTKDLIQLPDGSKKANLDVEIAVDMITLSNYCSTMILLSGDGDLAYAVNTVAYLGTQVEVVSLHTMTSDSLINVADCYTDLATIKDDIQKERR